MYKAEGIILKRKNAGEADRILTIFTKQFGKIRVIAKGVRRTTSRRSAHLEVFKHVSFSCVSAVSMDMLVEVETIVTHSDREVDLSHIADAYYVCELIDVFMPEKLEHEEVFFLLSRAINAIQTDKQYIVRKEFPRILLEYLGYFPKGEAPHEEVDTLIEQLIEKKLRTPRFFSRVV
jgi:DNA repair protein RecO (recombination protein O)